MIRLQVRQIGLVESAPSRGALSQQGILRLEVDGVDLAAGKLEGPILPPLIALLEGLALLWRGKSRSESIAFDGGRLDLSISRCGEDATLSLVSLLRPAHVIFQDVEVSLERLAEAAVRCAEDLHQEWERSPDVDRLGRGLQALAKARRHPLPLEVPADRAPTFLRSSPAGERLALGFEIQDSVGRLGSYRGGSDLDVLLVPGALYLHTPTDPVPLAIHGAPYLLMRDLVDGALRLLQAARDGLGSFTLPLGRGAPSLLIDLEARSIAVEGRSQVVHEGPDSLAGGIFRAALELVEAIRGSQPVLAEHPLLQSLEEDARIRLALCEERAGWHQSQSEPLPLPSSNARAAKADDPLALGSMRRVTLRSFGYSYMHRLQQTHQQGARVWLKHRRGLHRYHVDRWEEELRMPLAAGDEVAVAGIRDPFFVLGAQSLACHDPQGRLRWRRRAEGLHGLKGLHYPRGRDVAFLWVNGASLLAISPKSGEELYRFEPPTAHAGLMVRHERLVAIAADNGLVYGVDASGPAVAWRVPVAQPLEKLAIGAGLIWGASTSRGTATIDGLDPATGRPLFRVELPLSQVGSLLPTPTGLVVAGVGSAGGELLLVDRGGRLRWRARPLLGKSAPKLARSGGAIFARGSMGVSRIERGKVRWNVPCGPGGPPAVVRGLVALPGERIALLDAVTGRSVLDPKAEFFHTTDFFHQTPAGTLLSCSYDGQVEPLRLMGALAVVPPLDP